MMINIIPRLSERDEQRMMIRLQEEGLDWGEAWGMVSETQAPRHTIWWRCDQAEMIRWQSQW